MDFEINVHAKVGHAFMNAADEAVKRAEKLGLGGFDIDTVQSAWKSTFKFLEYYMKGRGANLNRNKNQGNKKNKDNAAEDDPTLAGLSKSARKKELKRRANEAKKKAKEAAKAKTNSKKKKKDEELDPTKYHENRLKWLDTVDNPYPHKFHVELNAQQFCDKFGKSFKDGEKDMDTTTSVAGRVLEIREAGKKLAFVVIQDEGCELQVQLQLDTYGSGKKSDDDVKAYVVFEREAREFQSHHVFMFQLRHSNHKNITRIAHSYHKKITRNSTLEHRYEKSR